MKHKGPQLLVAVVLSSFAFAYPAMAENTEWKTGAEMRSTLAFLRDKLVTKIECRDTGKLDFNIHNFEYRVTYVKGDGGTKLLWAIGSEYGRYEKKARREGYKQVSYSQFVRTESGLRFKCGVWHKKG